LLGDIYQYIYVSNKLCMSFYDKHLFHANKETLTVNEISESHIKDCSNMLVENLRKTFRSLDKSLNPALFEPK